MLTWNRPWIASSFLALNFSAIFDIQAYFLKKWPLDWKWANSLSKLLVLAKIAVVFHRPIWPFKWPCCDLFWFEHPIFNQNFCYIQITYHFRNDWRRYSRFVSWFILLHKGSFFARIYSRARYVLVCWILECLKFAKILKKSWKKSRIKLIISKNIIFLTDRSSFRI